jgi:callose synthase
MAAERRALDEPQGPGAGSASNTTVPQTLLQQANIDAILQTADELAKENPHVARICMCKFNLFPRLELKVA